MKKGQLPERIVNIAIKKYPQLRNVRSERNFCERLRKLERIAEISDAEYFKIFVVSRGGTW